MRFYCKIHICCETLTACGGNASTVKALLTIQAISKSIVSLTVNLPSCSIYGRVVDR